MAMNFIAVVSYTSHDKTHKTYDQTIASMWPRNVCNDPHRWVRSTHCCESKYSTGRSHVSAAKKHNTHFKPTVIYIHLSLISMAQNTATMKINL